MFASFIPALLFAILGHFIIEETQSVCESPEGIRGKKKIGGIKKADEWAAGWVEWVESWSLIMRCPKTKHPATLFDYA